MAGKYFPELPNFMQYYTWCHAHVIRTRRLCTSSAHHPHTSSAHVIRAHHPNVIHASSAHRLHVVCTLSACHLCMRVCCPHQDTSSAHCRPSAPLLMVTVGLNYLLLWQEFVIEWNLWQECWIVSFQDHVNDLRDNLCCWFSLHVKSGHCSHLICICTCHLHIIWGICVLCTYYLQWSLISSFLTDNANVIYMSSLVLFIDPYMLYTHIHIICYVSFTFLI